MQWDQLPQTPAAILTCMPSHGRLHPQTVSPMNPSFCKLLLPCILSQQGEEQLIHKLRLRIRFLQTNRIQINVPLCFLVVTAEKKVLHWEFPKCDNATGWLSSLLQSDGNFKRWNPEMGLQLLSFLFYFPAVLSRAVP